jgi:AraC-like DNA-binding protein
MQQLRSSQLVEAPGLQTLLQSRDFGEWDAVVATTLGHHRSTLLSGAGSFDALMRGGSVDEFKVLLIRGRGQVQLQREQCNHGVLWLPLEGLTHEIINGSEYIAEPGMALLFQPGDQMDGSTSEEMLGISILIPKKHFQGSGFRSPLIDRGPPQRKLINAALQLSEAAAWKPCGATHSAALLAEALHQCGNSSPASLGKETLSSRRRRDMVAQGCEWMSVRLADRFTVVELSEHLGVSVRALQYAFHEELGHSPMAQAKILRLRNLRKLLQQDSNRHHQIARLMESSGLLACGATAADYRRWCGESPRQTRLKG